MALFYNIVVQTVIERSHMNNTINLINLKENDVESIDTARKEKTLYIYLTLKKVKEICPSCGTLEYKIKDYKTRKINHPILNDENCIIVYRQRRYICDTCRKTFYEKNPFFQSNKSYSSYTRLRVLKELKTPETTFKKVAENCNLNVNTVIDIFDDLGIAKRLPLPEILCIDEFYDPSRGVGKYNCILMNFKNSQIVDILSDRTKNYLGKYFQAIPKKERDNVKHISIDMWEPYKDIAITYFNKAIISVDPFHVIEHINTALKKVRVRIMKKYDSKSDEYYLLKHFNWLLNKSFFKLKDGETELNRRLTLYLNNVSTLYLLLKIDDELKYAYDLKERYLSFNKLKNKEFAAEQLNEIINEYKLSGINEFIEVASTLKHWKEEIINSFSFYNDRKITNGPIESKNGTIRKILSNGNGYTNFQRERNRIFYCFNNQWIADPLLENIKIKRKGKPRGKYKKTR